MKKTILLFAILFMSGFTYGQFTFGPKIGFTSSKLYTDLPDIKEQARANFQIGAFARVGKKVYVQPELVYSGSGGIFKNETGEGSQKIKFKNLEIPVLLGFKLLDLKVANLRVFLGPSASFILGKEVEADDVIQDPISKEDFKNVQWGMNAGAGVDVLFLTLDLRYQWGLNNIYEAESSGDTYSMKNNLFVVSLGFKLL